MGSPDFRKVTERGKRFAAERRWESEGGNPGELQQALCDDRKEDATTGPAAKHAEGILLQS